MDIPAQALGIVGMVIIISSFQFKSNRTFFLMQGTGSFMFFMNFILIGAYGGALFNLCNLVRGLVFMKAPEKKWKLIVVELSYAVCFAVSAVLDSSPKQVILVLLPCVALMIMSVYMWLGNSNHIRICQIACSSPAWLVHNVFNLSIGGLICECFNIISSVIYLIRQKREAEAGK